MTDEELLAQTWTVCGSLNHDGITYADGTQLPPGFFHDAEQVKALRFYQALALPAELLPPADLQAQLSAKEAELTTLRDRLAAFEAAQAAKDATFQQPAE